MKGVETLTCQCLSREGKSNFGSHLKKFWSQTGLNFVEKERGATDQGLSLKTLRGKKMIGFTLGTVNVDRCSTFQVPRYKFRFAPAWSTASYPISKLLSRKCHKHERGGAVSAMRSRSTGDKKQTKGPCRTGLRRPAWKMMIADVFGSVCGFSPFPSLPLFPGESSSC